MNLNRLSWDDLRIFFNGIVMLPLFARPERSGLREVLGGLVDVRHEI
jgi:hypothetical protein